MTRLNDGHQLSFDGSGLSIAIVCARFNDHIGKELLAGAYRGLERCQVASERIDEVWVPGAFEVPLAAATLARSGKYDAVITLGAVIRGETPHFEFVAREVSRGVNEVAARHRIPVAFGVLTTDNLEQALARAGSGHGNKGYEAAVTALEMADLVDRLARG